MGDFFLLQDPNVRWVVLAMMLICGSAAVVGCFAFLRKRSLVGDAVSHAILPGICLAFMLAQTKHPVVLMFGAVSVGLFSLWLIDFITDKSKIKPDAALALVMSVFYGIGILLMTSIQASGNAAQSGLDKFLFGKAAAMMQEDVIAYGVFSLVLLAIVLLFFKSFSLIIFDREHAQVIGLPVKQLESLMALLTVFAIAIGIQAVGVVLMSALLITPAAAARYWTHNLKVMLVLAAFFAVLSGIGGAYISYTIPKMPTGPWIVVLLTFMTIISVLFGAKKGVWFKSIENRRMTSRMVEENILKILYMFGEKEDAFDKQYSIAQLKSKRKFNLFKFKTALKRLESKGAIQRNGNQVSLTAEGIEKGKRVTRLHRLWELYLTKYLNLPADHVHEEAEAMEHLITPELEKELEKELDYPHVDPHDSPIPR
ncbi:iron chelate uptake ABC transporter family permease subunit [Limibacter armeniacum]|uniref:metal ABC transporter permease n=1 Tax=Limibacter armeniacum TaxID=466084 RepID=UPI002FE5BFB5